MRRFDAEVIEAEPGNRYQSAADFLIRNRDQELLNRVIRLAVLSASRSLSPAERRALVEDEDKLRTLEMEGAWALDPGVEAFGKLLKGLPGDVRGPVITTNFDPLIEVAVRLAGGKPSVQHFDRDGRIGTSEEVGAIDVIHVHGFWRRGDTLHTVNQLTRERPHLDGSLRESLRGHVVVVLGYSGWSDAFSKSLLARAMEGQALGMDVVWCSFRELRGLDFRDGLFRDLSGDGLATFYSPTDVNVLLPRLTQALASDSGPTYAGTVQMKGWTTVTPEYLALRQKADEGVEVHRGRYFDGLDPDWAVASDPSVPHLSFSISLYGAILKAIKTPYSQPLVVGVGLMGEGKSTALRQCVTKLTSAGLNVHLFWREPGSGLDVKEVLSLPRVTGREYVLASDDCDLMIGQLRLLFEKLRELGRQDIHVLGVAQEREWRNSGGFVRLSNVSSVVKAPALSSGDAQALVGAWATLGASGLGRLWGVSEGERVAMVEAASQGASGSPQSLIGAMLELRYGSALVERVGDLLGRLDNYGEVGSTSLTEAFLMVALMHVAGESPSGSRVPISKRLLANACAVDEMAVEYLILEPLGAEAAIARHSNNVWVRHRALADAALAASRSRDRSELVGAIRRLVHTSVVASPLMGGLDDDLYAVAYMSRKLTEAPEAIAAADAAIEAQPARMSYAVSQVTAYRLHGKVDEAVNLAEQAWTDQSSKVDPEGIDALLTAWATACGMSNRSAENVLLDARLLVRQIGDPRGDHAARALLGMGVGLTKLHSQTRKNIFADALGGVVTLLEDLNLEGNQVGWRDKHRATCKRMGVRFPIDDPWRALQLAVDELLNHRSGWGRSCLGLTSTSMLSIE